MSEPFPEGHQGDPFGEHEPPRSSRPDLNGADYAEAEAE